MVLLHDHARNPVVTRAAKAWDAGGMDQRAVRRAALVTVRRAIRERFPPGLERTACLRWLLAQHYARLVEKVEAARKN